MWPFTKQTPPVREPRQLATRRVHVMKRADVPESVQLKDPELGLMYQQGLAFEPPLDPLALVMLAESNEMHSSAIDAKAVDSSGRGYAFEPKATVEDPDSSELDAVTEKMKGLCPDFPITECIYQAAYEMDAIGWAGWEVLRDANGVVAAVYPVPGHTLRATVDRDIWVQIRDSRIVYFKRFGIEGKLNRFTGRWDDATDPKEAAAELIIFKRYSTRSSYYSIPRWVSALPTLSELAAMRTFRTSFFESSGVLDKLVFVKSRENVGAALDDIEALFRDAKRQQHGAAIVELPEGADVQIEELATAIKEGRTFGDQRNDLNLSVLIAHAVPPYRVGWPMTGSLAGNAAKEMLTAYRYGAVEPMQTALEHRLAQTLFGPQGFNLQSYDLVFEDLDWAETELNLKLAIETSRWGVASVNEARRYLGLDAAEDPALDKHYYNGKVLDSSEDALRIVDLLRDIRTQFDKALSEEQEAALDAAVGAVAGDNNAEVVTGPSFPGGNGAAPPEDGGGDLSPEAGALEQ